jgi:hypothetical protein
LSSPYTTLGVPNDPVAWAALGLGSIALVVAALRPAALAEQLRRLPTRALVGILALVAMLLSAGYVVHYLRGGPRIIDATSYLLEARTFARGALSFAVPEPSASFRGRFLLPTPSGELTVIFPPGYPALLALGTLAHAPMAVGPLLAAALVVATYDLTHRLSQSVEVARLAALLSVVCATLRYHTADTMSHGLAALLLTVGLAAATRAGTVAAIGSGLSLGWLLATRPVTGVVGLILAVILLARQPRLLVGFGLALVPGLLLLAAHQHAGTGHFFESTQLRYYELADGPPGCFRYGFGAGIGCLFEHGDFVRARLASGYGLVEALGNTMRRLALHSVDIANAVPLAGVLIYGAWIASKRPGLRILVAGALGLIAAYAPFYFDGSYPGGGARLFAEALPLEHGLLAFGLVRLKIARFGPALALLGFAVHQSHAHLALREREGGRPMFEPSVLERAGATRGLVFVDTDHGFNLGHEPGGQDAQSAVVVARLRGDAHDRWLWERLGRPRSYRYVFDPKSASAQPKLSAYEPATMQRLEAEAEWPPSTLTGWAHPDHSPCASGGRGLFLRGAQGGDISFEVQAGEPGDHELRIGWSSPSGAAPSLTARLDGRDITVTGQPKGAAQCGRSNAGPLTLKAGTARLTLSAPAPVFLDYIELAPWPAPEGEPKDLALPPPKKR